MKKILASTIALAMAFGLTACGGGSSSAPSSNATSTPADGSSSAVSSTPVGGGTVVLGTSADYPPFEFHIIEDDKDKIVGFEVALAEAIAEDMGAELQITDMSFENLIALLAKGDCDFVIAAMEASEERLNASSCSDPYYTDLPAMLVTTKEKAEQFTAMDSFAGVSMGAQSGTTKADIVTSMFTDSTPVLLSSVTDLINELVYDKCDVLMLDGAVAEEHVASNDNLVILDASILSDEANEAMAALPFCVWVEKDDPKGLLPSINETIARVLADGSMDQFIADAAVQSSAALES